MICSPHVPNSDHGKPFMIIFHKGTPTLLGFVLIQTSKQQKHTMLQIVLAVMSPCCFVEKFLLCFFKFSSFVGVFFSFLSLQNLIKIKPRCPSAVISNRQFYHLIFFFLAFLSSDSVQFHCKNDA